MARKEDNTFTFHIDWQEVLKEYPAEVRLEVYDAVIEYAATGTLSELKPLSKMAFSFIRKEMDDDARREASERGRRSLAGKEGMRSRWGREITDDNNVMDVITEITDDNKDNNVMDVITEITDDNKLLVRARDNSLSISCVDVNNNITPEKEESKEIGGAGGKGKKTPRRFVKPSVEEVQAYCDERDNGVDARSFVDFYESKGWMVGKNPMKDWKAAVRTWEQRDDFRVNRQPSGRQKPTLADIYAENDRQLQETLRKIQERYGTE